MRHGSLFSGIGGFDLAASWMGWKNVFQVEIDPFCQAVLKKHFPNTIRHGDIKEFDGTKYRGAIDVLSGGFPCQPFSQAGKRKGKDDDRYLWPEMLRVIREVRPCYIVAENVSGILNQERGVVFETVCTQMENEGYEIQPVIIPACAVEAQIRRDRVWFVGHLPGTGGLRQGEFKGIQERLKPERRRTAQRLFDPLYRTDSRSYRCGKSEFVGVIDGIPGQLDRLGMIGNAIHPGVALEIFKAIQSVAHNGGGIETQ